ncbi:MAG: carbon storage regulator [Gammaproteobacteria bacterium]|nr:carbon storage regulator [Gammaproteobacteria bacterium]
MLVLTRYPGQKIVIGNDFDNSEKNITINIRENQVRLGLKAPKEISVHRQEIFERIKADKIQAASAID